MIVKLLLKLSPSGCNAVFYSLVALVVIAMHNWILHPQLSYLKAVEQLSPVVESRNQEQQSLQQRLTVRQTMLDRLMTEYQEHSDLLYTPEDLLRFEGDACILAGLAGCEIVSWELTQKNAFGRNGPPEASGEDIVTQVLHVQVNGPYDGLLDLIENIQRDFKGLGLRDLKVTRGTGQAGQLSCSFSLEVNVIKHREVLIDETSDQN